MSCPDIPRRTALAALAALPLATPALAEAAAGDEQAKIRVVLIANSAAGRSHVVSDARMQPGQLWANSVAEPLGPAGAGDLKSVLPATNPLAPPRGAATVNFAIIPPGTARPADGTPDENGIHVTASVDAVYILDDGLSLLLDEGKVDLQAGDLVIQRNARHAWHNARPRGGRILGIMLGV